MAVYTEVSDEDLEGFLARYDVGGLLSAKGIAEGVENSNYLVHAEAGYFILTLYEKRVRREELPFFLGLMEHLAARGITCPTPVHDRRGEAVQTLNGRPAALVTFLDGISVRRPRGVHCAALGAGLAAMHEAGRDFPIHRPNALSVGDWRALLAMSGPQADTVQPGLFDELSRELDHLEAVWPSALPAGVIHADLFPDNVFFINGALSGFIDFYFACNDLLAYDLAVCLNAWCFEAGDDFNVTKARALFAAYQSVRPLTGAEIEAMPVLARGAALRFLLTRLYDWLSVPPGALVRPKNPHEYLRKLRFHRRASNAAEYGLAA